MCVRCLRLYLCDAEDWGGINYATSLVFYWLRRKMPPTFCHTVFDVPSHSPLDKSRDQAASKTRQRPQSASVFGVNVYVVDGRADFIRRFRDTSELCDVDCMGGPINQPRCRRKNAAVAAAAAVEYYQSTPNNDALCARWPTHADIQHQIVECATSKAQPRPVRHIALHHRERQDWRSNATSVQTRALDIRRRVCEHYPRPLSAFN